MAQEYLDSVVIEPTTPARASVIWLHGLGADGHDFAPIVPHLQLAVPVRYIFPHAPHRPVTVNGGYVMRAWYDIVSFDRSGRADEVGINATKDQVFSLIERELARGIAAERILLAGFSQGGAIALHAGLRYPRRLAGIMALSTYLPLADTVSAEAADANKAIPIFLAHGSNDGVIALPHAQISKQRLEDLGYSVEWHCYAMAHSVCDEEITHMRRYMERILAEA